jgi:hypothetical protein
MKKIFATMYTLLIPFLLFSDEITHIESNTHFLSTPFGLILGVVAVLGICFIIWRISCMNISAKTKVGDFGLGRIEEHAEKTNDSLKEIKDIVYELKRKYDKIDLALLRLQIFCDQIPVSERDSIFHEYEKLGGNGFTKIYYTKKILPELQRQFPETKIED